jgi:osmotically-inducible protein OsmY
VFLEMHARSAAIKVRVQEGSEQLRGVVAAEARKKASSKLEKYRKVQEVSL